MLTAQKIRDIIYIEVERNSQQNKKKGIDLKCIKQITQTTPLSVAIAEVIHLVMYQFQACICV